MVRKDDPMSPERFEQLLQIKMMEEAMNLTPNPQTGNFFTISARIGENGYNIKVKSKEDLEIAMMLINLYNRMMNPQ